VHTYPSLEYVPLSDAAGGLAEDPPCSFLLGQKPHAYCRGIRDCSSARKRPSIPSGFDPFAFV